MANEKISNNLLWNPQQAAPTGGLLGVQPTGIRGLLSDPFFIMGASLLANNGNGGIGKGLLHGISLNQNIQQRKIMNDLARRQYEQEEAEKEEARRQAEAQQRAKLNVVGLLSQEPVELQGPPMPGESMGYRMEANPQKQQQYSALATGYPEVFQKMVQSRFAPEKIKPTAGMQDYAFSQRNPDYLEFLKNKQPQTNIHMPPQENERQKAYGKSVGGFFGDQFSQLQQGVNKAVEDDSRLDRLDQLLDQVNVGAASSLTQPLKRYAKDFGIDLESMGITDDTGPAEAASALANQMALELRNPSGGAGMPGAMSDKDREFLVSMVPQMTNTHEGRKLLIETRRRQNQRSKEVAGLARRYQQKNGMLDAGFYSILQQYSEANPLFNDLNVSPEDPQTVKRDAKPQKTRSLEGKQYIKIDGKWYQQ